MADDTIQYKRYNACICSYLTSGISGAVRYRFEKVGNARVFYPYVLNEQFERFNKGQGVVLIERCKDKSSRDYADWNTFLLVSLPKEGLTGYATILCLLPTERQGMFH